MELSRIQALNFATNLMCFTYAPCYFSCGVWFLTIALYCHERIFLNVIFTCVLYPVMLQKSLQKLKSGKNRTMKLNRWLVFSRKLY